MVSAISRRVLSSSANPMTFGPGWANTRRSTDRDRGSRVSAATRGVARSDTNDKSASLRSSRLAFFSARCSNLNLSTRVSNSR